VVHTVQVGREPSAWVGVFAVLILIGVVLTYWPIALGVISLLLVAFSLHRRHQSKQIPVEQSTPVQQMRLGPCWVKQCRRQGEWKVSLTKQATGATSLAVLCTPHLDSLSQQLPLKEQYTRANPS
jgi:hypothetical protein